MRELTFNQFFVEFSPNEVYSFLRLLREKGPFPPLKCEKWVVRAHKLHSECKNEVIAKHALFWQVRFRREGF